MLYRRTTIKGYIAICFAAGVIGALAVIVFSLVLYYTGISASLGAGTPPKLAAPDIYLIGWLYFLAPVLALYFIFAPMRGLGVFGQNKGLLFTFYLLLVNVPYGIVTAVLARWLSPPTSDR